MRIGAVLAASLVAVAVALALVLLESKPRQAGSNYIVELEEALTIKGSGSHCQGNQVIPADASAVRVLVGTYERPTPELRVSVTGGGELISSGRLPAGRREGHLFIPIDRVDELRDGAEACIEVRGASNTRRTVLYGFPGRARFEWLREGSESWLELLPTVAHRFGLGKPFLSGSWLLAFVAVLVGVAWLLALRLILREVRR